MMYLKFFRSQRYRALFDYLDKTGGFFEYRWGDALVRTFAVNLLLEEREVHLFEDIPYSHGGWRNSANCTFYEPPDNKCPAGICKHCDYMDRTYLRDIDPEQIRFAFGVAVGVGIPFCLLLFVCAIFWVCCNPSTQPEPEAKVK